MTHNPIETIMGAVVLLVAALFLVFASSTTGLKQGDGYRIDARFAKVGGLKVGSDVRISGVKVGTVSAEYLDPQTFQAVVELTIKTTVKLPDDSVASIASDGFLGGAYLKIEPGASATMVPEKGRLTQVRDYQSLEDLVGRIIFLATRNESSPAQGGGIP